MNLTLHLWYIYMRLFWMENLNTISTSIWHVIENWLIFLKLFLGFMVFSHSQMRLLTSQVTGMPSRRISVAKKRIEKWPLGLMMQVQIANDIWGGFDTKIWPVTICFRSQTTLLSGKRCKHWARLLFLKIAYNIT